MALGGLAVALIVADTLLRRLILPLALLSAVIFRYNLVSFSYLLLLLIIFLLPGPRLKSQKVTNIIYLSILTALSGVVTLVQLFFQISLATSYKDELNIGCSEAESIWRQVGFVLLDIPGEDVARQFVLDLGVFLVSLATLVIDIFVVVKLRPPKPTTTGAGSGDGQGGANGTTTGDNDKEETEIEAHHVDSENGTTDGLLSHHTGPPYPKNIQCYWEIPKAVSYTLEFGIFVMLGLSGVAVPSLTSFVYYAVFLVLLVIWSVHVRLAGLVRVLRTLLTLHSALHLLVLHLFQFSAAQNQIQLGPCPMPDSNDYCNTTNSLLARLFGLTPIIMTDCVRPTQLLLWPGLNYTMFLSPAFVFILYWLLATDFRMWMFTPQILWKLNSSFSYYLPIQDESPSQSVHCVLKRNSRRSQILGGSRSYGPMGPSALQEGVDGESEGSRSPDLVAPVLTSKKKLGLGRNIWIRVRNNAWNVWIAILSVTFIFTVVAMMFWSVLYPSWPSLVFLLWSCVIWLVPQLNPRKSVFYSSPILVTYSFILLLIQYAYSLHLFVEEFNKNNDVVPECHFGREEGCKSIALLAKTLFTVIFFASFHEFMREMNIKVPKWWAKHRRQAEDTDSSELTDSVKAANAARSKIYLSVQRLLRTYWVLAVVGAFLLVTLTGEPSALKTVYLVCFFIFMITYQLSPRYWFYLCFPVWSLLVVYAAIHLILIYTFPLTAINNVWMDLVDESSLSGNISAHDLFRSVGFLEYDNRQFRKLLVTLVPPAVFIAVMAMQLRYFRPRSSVATAGDQVDSQATIDIYSFLPKAFRDTLSKLSEGDIGEDSDEEPDGDDDVDNADNDEESDEITPIHRRSPSMQSIKSAALRESHPKLYSCYRYMRYAFHKTRQLIVDLNNTFWRFMELHLHKIAVLVLFATTISQISAAYWILLVLVLIVVPLPYLNPITYPIITLYLGMLCTTKMVYNFPIMSQYYLNFTSSSARPCDPVVERVEGIVYRSTYSPFANDTNWIGLHPAEDFAHYISLPIICVLLLSFWFSARRYQARHYRNQNIVVGEYERRSLFLHVARAEAEVSILPSLKYLINHFFEMYGLEVCWAMLAITVAIRIDVYGVIYAVVLGVLFMAPRFIIRPIWFIILPLHGILLAVQYFFLLGAPPSVCYNEPGSTVYPWSGLNLTDLIDNGTSIYVSSPAFKKWLFIPDDTQQILNSHLLYADFLVYIVVCLQIVYVFRNPLKRGTPDQVGRGEGDVPNFYEVKHWIDYFKVFIFQYSFWFSLFLLFFTAAYRVSLFGIFYLLVGFVFLFRGQQMLRDRQRIRHIWWSVLRWLTWFTLLVRVCLQILDCVFWEKIHFTKSIDNCLLILLFNGACTEQPYFGSAVPVCGDEPINLGLWIDALNFIVVSLQIIIFDTQHAEVVKNELTTKVNQSESFRKIFDKKVKEYQEAQKMKKDKEIEELVERTEKLVVSEKKIDHLLYAGVRVPKDIEIRRPRGRTSTSTSKAEEDADLVTSTTITPESMTSAEERERGSAKKLYDQFIEIVDWVIEQLEQGSSLYRQVVGDIKESQSPAHVSTESEPIALGRTRYGSTDDTPQPPPTTVIVEVHEEAAKLGDQQPEAGKEEDEQQTEKPSKKKKKKKKLKKSKSVGFDVPGESLIDELHVQPSEKQQEEIQQIEGELEERAYKATSRLRRLSIAIYYFLLAHSDYPVFFFIILNIILNGSVLSMVYAFLLYTWGLLSIPWPTRKFWLTLIFYTMSVLLIKYAFQFHEINYWMEHFDSNSGLYPPLVLGILHRKNFFTNAVWDILLLIALLLHRGLLVQYGLWSAGPKEGIVKSFTNIFKQLWHDVKDFFVRMFDPNKSQGAKDYYAVMLFFDLLCFLTIVFGVNSFGIGIQTRTVADLTAVANLVRSNNVPLLFVALLLLQFLSMVVDRAIYLRRSLPARFVFQIILLIGWHVGLFFILPSDPLTGRPFTSNAAAQCLYFFKSCYFIASSLQIVAGYPARILGYLLTSSYNVVAWLAFLVYRLIPLLPELRETMDWTFTDTSLSLINWFKVQEIYSLIYLVKAQRTREKAFPRNLGQKQSWLIKIFAGGLVLIGLVVLIWLPLLLISIIGQASEPNPPVQVDIKLSIGGFQPLVELSVQDRDIFKLNNAEYSRLGTLFNDSIPFPVFSREFQQDDFRRVVFPGQSTSLWTISPPSRGLLIHQLNNLTQNSNLSIPLDFSWSIKRAPSSSSNVLETVSGITTQFLSSKSADIVNELLKSLQSEMPVEIIVNLTNLYPTLINAPSSEQSSNFSQLSVFVNQGVPPNVSCSLTRNKTNGSEVGVEWWSLNQSSQYVVAPPTDGQLEMIIYSERVAPQIFSFLSGLGIITLYVSVVLVIGRFIRTYIADLPYRLAVDEILNPDPLIKLCHDIFTVRERGDLKLEEILVGKLFYIFRSSERIVRITEDLKEKTD